MDPGEDRHRGRRTVGDPRRDVEHERRLPETRIAIEDHELPDREPAGPLGPQHADTVALPLARYRGQTIVSPTSSGLS